MSFKTLRGCVNGITFFVALGAGSIKPPPPPPPAICTFTQFSSVYMLVKYCLAPPLPLTGAWAAFFGLFPYYYCPNNLLHTYPKYAALSRLLPPPSHPTSPPKPTSPSFPPTSHPHLPSPSPVPFPWPERTPTSSG